MADRIKRDIEELGSQAGRELGKHKRATQRMLRRARDRASDIGDETLDQVRRHPVTALAIAFGAGAAFAFIVGAIARNRNA